MADTPKIRFKGFTDAWEQRKLEDIMSCVTDYVAAGSFADIRKNVTYLSEPDYAQLVRTVDLKKKFSNNDFVFIDKNAFEYLWRVNLSEECIVLPNIGANIGEVYHVKPSDLPCSNNVLGPNAILLKTNEDTYFVFTALGTDTFQNQLFENVGSSGQPKFNKTELKNITLTVPSKEEQIRIGAYFSDLDTLITLHQRKCDETKELKKYMLQKMFPQNDKKIPEIRFAGFTDDWEQRKLSEISVKVTEKNKNNLYDEPFTNSAEMGIISQKEYFDREIVNEDNLDGYYVVQSDDFVYNPRVSVTAPVGPINRNRLGRNGVMSPLYTVFRTHDVDTLYLEHYFKTTSWHRFMKLNGDSGARFDRFTISSTQFMEMPIPYPSIMEQQKIGQYFDMLDNLITLHQRKCDELKEVKKFMLQNMFPQKG